MTFNIMEGEDIMIDLHVHTNYSDGSDSLIDVLKIAESKNVKCLSITDHNNCNAYKELEAINVKDYYSGNIISGIELNTKLFGIPIEVLGFGIDPKKMNQITSENYLTMTERNIMEIKKLIKKCRKNGFKIDADVLEKYDSSVYPSVYLHKIIMHYGRNRKRLEKKVWYNSTAFYREYMSDPENIFYLDTTSEFPTFDECCKFIREAGGLVFLPHIHEYREKSEMILSEILENHHIDGIECYYTTFNKKQTERLVKLCKERNLYISGGSDYHGLFKPNIQMCIGEGDLVIPEEIVDDWKDKVIWL